MGNHHSVGNEHLPSTPPAAVEALYDRKEIERQLGRKHSIAVWKDLSVEQREGLLRQAYLAPRSLLPSVCSELGLGLWSLFQILRDNKFRPREFLQHDSDHDHHGHQHAEDGPGDSADIEHHSSSLEHQSHSITSALELRNILLDPRTFAAPEAAYQSVSGWDIDTTPILLPDGRGGHATLPLRDADGDQLCGRIIADYSGNIIAIEGAQLLTDGVNFRDDKAKIRFQVDGKPYYVRLDSRAARAFPDTGTEKNREEYDNGYVFRLSEVRPTLDREGRITIEKNLQNRLREQGYRSREAVRDLVIQLLERYSEEELGIVAENERVGWKKLFGGGKVKSLTFITRIPTDPKRDTPAEQARRLSSYGPNEPAQIPVLRERGGSELANERLSVETNIRLSHRLRDLPSLSDRAFYREWLTRTPVQQQSQRIRWIVEYGREQALSMQRQALSRDRSPTPATRQLYAALSESAFVEQGMGYLLGTRAERPAGLEEALFHGREIASQLCNGNLDEFLTERGGDVWKANRAGLLRIRRDILEALEGQAELDHEHKLALSEILASQVFAVASDITGRQPNGEGEQRTEFPIPIPWAKKITKNLSGKIETVVAYDREDGWTREIPVSINYRIIDHLDREGGKHLLVEVGGGWNGTHAHGIFKAGRMRIGFEAEGSWNWKGLVSEVDGWIQWYDAAERSRNRLQDYRDTSGYHTLCAGLSERLRTRGDIGAAITEYFERPQSQPEAERLRSYLIRQTNAFLSGSEAEPEVRSMLLLRGLRNYDLALRESAVLHETRRSPLITGVKFGFLLTNGTIIPLFGPLLRQGIKLRKAYRIEGVADVDAGEVVALSSLGPKMKPGGDNWAELNRELHHTAIEPGEVHGEVRWRFPDWEHRPQSDRTTYEVYAEPGIGLRRGATPGTFHTTGFAIALERTVIAANGERVVRLELYRSVPHVHDPEERHDHAHSERELVFRSFPYRLRDGRGRFTGTFARSTVFASDIPREASGKQPEQWSVISRLEQQRLVSDPTEVRDRRRVGLSVPLNAPSQINLQFLDTTAQH